ncbi:response regulator transcription factor [Oricola nitratireducens]|uniref:response regulator transcription factor n=1 Tax=Oricola nitratireducens TaxID=2775868 RepID=UPI0018682E6B|nr:response regulator transcription factor [Oricola nitratireducens]
MRPAFDQIPKDETKTRKESTVPDRPTIIYIGPTQAFSDCLTRNLTYEFPDFGFRRFADIDEARRWYTGSQGEVRLIVVDDSLCAALLGEADVFGQIVPNPIICISFNQIEPSDQCLNEFFGGGVVRSCLPMNLRLDIWLSAIRLMLNGGNYCPPEVMEAFVKRLENDTSAARPAPRKPAGNRGGGSRLRKLTRREEQVMELASQGFQNKNIAEQLGLSEHTVKLHMHNIISKLGATNRTEAAGIFLDHYASKKAVGPALN